MLRKAWSLSSGIKEACFASALSESISACLIPCYLRKVMLKLIKKARNKNRPYAVGNCPKNYDNNSFSFCWVAYVGFDCTNAPNLGCVFTGRGWSEFTYATGSVRGQGANVALSHDARQPGHQGPENCQSVSGRCDSCDIHVLRNYHCYDVWALMMYERSAGGWGEARSLESQDLVIWRKLIGVYL